MLSLAVVVAAVQVRTIAWPVLTVEVVCEAPAAAAPEPVLRLVIALARLVELQEAPLMAVAAQRARPLEAPAALAMQGI